MSKNIYDLERERDAEIVRLARDNPRWSLRDIAKEIQRTYGKCSHEHVRTILERHGINQKK